MPVLEANLDDLLNKYDVIALAHSDLDSTNYWVKNNLIGKLSKESAFILLFSFHNFCYFHKCLGYLLQNKTIDENYFQNFISFIQKK